MITLAVVLMLPVWYVAAWLAVSRVARQGFVSGTVAANVSPAFAPIRRYSGSDLPGGHWLYSSWWRMNRPPSGWFQAAPNMAFAPCDESGQMPVFLDREPFRTDLAR